MPHCAIDIIPQAARPDCRRKRIRIWRAFDALLSILIRAARAIYCPWPRLIPRPRSEVDYIADANNCICRLKYIVLCATLTTESAFTPCLLGGLNSRIYLTGRNCFAVSVYSSILRVLSVLLVNV